MHIGSSSRMPATSPDAPFIVSSTLTFQNAMGSLLDYIFSGTLERFPTLRIAYSEGQVGWMPYVLERADKLWAERADNSFGTSLPRPPTSYLPGRVYGCIFDDETGLRSESTRSASRPTTRTRTRLSPTRRRLRQIFAPRLVSTPTKRTNCCAAMPSRPSGSDASGSTHELRQSGRGVGRPSPRSRG